MAKSSRQARPSPLAFALGIGRKLLADRVLMMSAAVSYGAVLSMAPLVILTLGLVGLVADRGEVQGYLVGQMQRLTGADTAGLIGELAAAEHEESSGILATIIGSITLLAGATTVFVQLQDGLNIIWNVEPKPGQGLMKFLRQRLLSLAMVLSLGFLLLISLVLSALLTALLHRVTFLSELEAVAGLVANVGTTLVLSTVLFALLFRYVPDARTSWRDVFLGGAVTAGIFHVGEWAIGQYLARAAVGSPYGKAGSVVVLLVWVFYSSLIVFAGAEFTQQWAERRGRGTKPDDHAKRGNVAAPDKAAIARRRRAKRRAREHAD